jgi:hypothetical protein
MYIILISRADLNMEHAALHGNMSELVFFVVCTKKQNVSYDLVVITLPSGRLHVRDLVSVRRGRWPVSVSVSVSVRPRPVAAQGPWGGVVRYLVTYFSLVNCPILLAK